MTLEQLLIVAGWCCFLVMIAYSGYVFVTRLRPPRSRSGELTVDQLKNCGFSYDEIKAMGRIPGVPARADLIKEFGADKMSRLFQREQEWANFLESNRRSRS